MNKSERIKKLQCLADNNTNTHEALLARKIIKGIRRELYMDIIKAYRTDAVRKRKIDIVV